MRHRVIFIVNAFPALLSGAPFEELRLFFLADSEIMRNFAAEENICGNGQKCT